MDDKELVQFHSSAESLTGEIAFRNVFRKAGFSEREMDGMILRAFLRKKLFKDWATLAVFFTCVMPFVLRLVFGIVTPAGMFLITFAVILVAVWALASYRSGRLAQTPEEWVRKRGRTWTGVWERRLRGGTIKEAMPEAPPPVALGPRPAAKPSHPKREGPAVSAVATVPAVPPPITRTITLAEGMTLKDLADKLGVPVKDVLTKLVMKRGTVTINSTCDVDTVREIAREFGADITWRNGA